MITCHDQAGSCCLSLAASRMHTCDAHVVHRRWRVLMRGEMNRWQASMGVAHRGFAATLKFKPVQTVHTRCSKVWR